MTLYENEWLANMKRMEHTHFVIIDVFIVSRFLLILIITLNLRLVRRWFHSHVLCVGVQFSGITSRETQNMHIYKFVCVENHNLANTQTHADSERIEPGVWAGAPLKHCTICHLIIMLYNKIITSMCNNTRTHTRALFVCEYVVSSAGKFCIWAKSLHELHHRNVRIYVGACAMSVAVKCGVLFIFALSSLVHVSYFVMFVCCCC